MSRPDIEKTPGAAAACTGVVVLAEALPPLVSEITGIMAALALTRLTQIAIMVWFFRYAGARDLHPENPWLGIKTGLVWSGLAGAAALAAGLLLNLLHIQPQALIQTNFPPENMGIFLITGVLLAPVAEELFFRGMVYSFLRTWNKTAAMILSSLVFTLFHGLPIGPAAAIPFTGGIIFCLACDRSKSILAPIIIHSLGNLAIFTLSAL